MTEYCTSCGRCKNCGAKQGVGPTIIYSTNIAAANAAAAPAYPITIETWGAAGAAAPTMVAGCEHLKVLG